MNIIDYIKKHKEDSFEDFPFNEIDSLIFAALPYIDFKGTIKPLRKEKRKLKDIFKELEQKNLKDYPTFIQNAYKMLQEMYNTKRYQDILLYNYIYIVNEEMQFGAITIKLPNKMVYVSFAGTDSSIIGWEEDFKMAYLYPGISQKYAANYFNKTVSILDKEVIVGGHSKGGNLAICSAMNSKKYLKYKIKSIYNFDGPGFLKEQIESKSYKKIEHKIKMFVPKDSIIGMLLYHVDNYKVVSSKSFSLFQHDAFNWECNDHEFKIAKQTNRSKNLEKKLTKKLEEKTIEQRLKIVNDLFFIFKNNQITDTKNIKIKEIFKLLKDFHNIDKETKNSLIEFLLISFI